MRIEILTLCDAATSNGKLNILGAFDQIITSQDFITKANPFIHPQLSVAVRIRFEQIEQGFHRVQINFVDIDGNFVVPPLQAEMEVRFPPNDTSGTINLVFNAQQIKFERFGEYAVDVAIDGKEEGSIPLFIKKLPRKS
jgi:hypothetical protein